jgi:hypothetical protein
MPLMRWGDFQEANARPFMVFADVDVRLQTRFTLLNSLAEAMAFKGGYALFPDRDLVRIAFERDDDATKFAVAVNARRMARESGWAGQWSFNYDSEMESAIRAALPSAPRKSSGTRAGTKWKKRALPF